MKARGLVFEELGSLERTKSDKRRIPMNIQRDPIL